MSLEILHKTNYCGSRVKEICGKDRPKDKPEANKLKAYGSTETKQEPSSTPNEEGKPEKLIRAEKAHQSSESQLATKAKFGKTIKDNQIEMQEKSPKMFPIIEKNENKKFVRATMSTNPQKSLLTISEKSIMTEVKHPEENTPVDEENESLLNFMNQQVKIPKTTLDEESKHDIKITKTEKQSSAAKEKRRVRFQEETEIEDAIQLSGNKTRSDIEEKVNIAHINRKQPEKTAIKIEHKREIKLQVAEAAGEKDDRGHYKKLQNTIDIQEKIKNNVGLKQGQLDKIESKTLKSEKAKDHQSKFHGKESFEDPTQEEEIQMFGEESIEKSDYLHENKLAITTAKTPARDVDFTEERKVHKFEKPKQIGKKEIGNDVDDIFILKDSFVGSENLDIVNLREAKIDEEFCDLTEDKEDGEAKLKSGSSWAEREPEKYEIIGGKNIAQIEENIKEASQSTETKPEIKRLTLGSHKNHSRKLENQNTTRETNQIIGSELQKLKISEPMPKDSKIPKARLKKITRFNQEPEHKFPSLRLKSRIATIEFPPLREKLQTINATFIGAFRENGILSRNVEEAKKVNRKQIRMLEDIESQAIELEKFDSEVDDKKIEHKFADSITMLKKGAEIVQKGVKQKTYKIKLRKGTIIENEEAKETINLKKVYKEKEKRYFEASAMEGYKLQASQLKTQPYEEIEITSVDFNTDDPTRPKIVSLKQHSIEEKAPCKLVNKEKLVFDDNEKQLSKPPQKVLADSNEEVVIERDQIKPEEINQPEEVCLQPFEKSQIKDEYAETQIQIEKINQSKEVANQLSIQRLKPVRKYSLPKEDTKSEVEEIPCVTFKPKITKSIEEVSQEFKITLFPYVEEEISLSSKIKLKRPGRQPTFEEESIEEFITLDEELEAGSEIKEIDKEKWLNVATSQQQNIKDFTFSLKNPYEIDDFDNVATDIKINPKEGHLEAISETSSLSICKEEDTFMDEAVCYEEADEKDFYTVGMQEASESQPIFIRRFEDQHNIEGTSLKLKAKVNGFPIPDIKWFRNDQLLVPSERIFMYREGEVIEFTIKQTNSELDTGFYKCLAKNSLGEDFVDAFVLVEVENVKFTKNLQKSYSVFERETVQLECETSHSVRTKWWFNETEITGMDHRAVIQDDRIHKLVIKNISRNDEGTYKCTIKNQNPITVVNIIQGKLEFVKMLQDLEFNEKDLAILEVEINSDSAEVAWFKDGVPIIEDTNSKFKTERDKGVRRLLMGPISIHDEGEYTCKLLEQECKADITVIELPPEISTPLQDQTVAKGDKAVFEIELTKGDAMVKWYKDGKEIKLSEHIQLSIDGKIQKLKIYPCEMEDHGTYSCKVSKQSCSAILNVYMPSCFWIKPLPEETIVPISADAEFNVEVSKDAELTWWRKEFEIESSTKYIVSNNKLVVKTVDFEDQDVYTCKVESFNLKTSSKLKVTDNATPLRDTLESVIADRSQLRDKMPSGKDQTRDQVSISEVTMSWLKENSMDADIHSYQKSQLLPKDEYIFKIWCYVGKLFK